MKKAIVTLLTVVMISTTCAFAWSCPGCFNEMDGKFCSECGTKRPENVCVTCGTNFGYDTPKFCSECGAKMIGDATNVATTEELTASAKGFLSDVTVTVSLDTDGNIASITVDASGETRGIGTRCSDNEDFLNQFIGKTGPFDAVDVLTGATFTSTAVIEAINSLFLEEKTALEEENQKNVWVEGLYRSDKTHVTDLILMKYNVYGYIEISGKNIYVGTYMSETVTPITGAKVSIDALANDSRSMCEAIDNDTYRCTVKYTDRITKEEHTLTFTFTFTGDSLNIEDVSTTETKGQETIFAGKYSLYE